MNGFHRPRVAAAIVTFNKRDAVLTLLDHLEARRIPTYVTENACSDGTAAAIRERHPWACLLESKHNLGGTGGFNCATLAALTSGAKYIVLLDDDVLPEGDCLEEMARFLDANPEYAYVAPSIYISSQPGVLQETGGDIQPFRDPAVESWNRFRRGGIPEERLDIGYASACCLMIRAEAILKTGVMEWAYFLFCDDVDWCVRLGRMAGKGACLPQSKAQHDFPWGKPFGSMRLYFYHRNNMLLFNRILRHDARFEVPLRRSLSRTAISWMRAAAAGDAEIRDTLSSAFWDAVRGRFGVWKNKPKTVAQTQAKLDAAFFRAQGVRRVLVVIHIEEFIDPIIKKLRECAGDASLEIHLLCDAHRAEHWRGTGTFAQVIGRAAGVKNRMREPWALRAAGYDLALEDMFMEPRGPNGMVARHAAIFHAGELYAMPRRLLIAFLVFLASPTLAKIFARIMVHLFPAAPEDAPAPAEAAELLSTIGIDPAVGTPRARYNSPRTLEAALTLCSARDAARSVTEHIEESGGFREQCALAALSSVPAPVFPATDGVPLFSILTPVCDPQAVWLHDLVDSVKRQTFGGWELILVDDASTKPEVTAFLKDVSADPRIRTVFRTERGNISRATNDGAALARGRYLFFLDHDDKLPPNALAAFAARIHAADNPAVIYADEDRFDDAGRRYWPGFKPEFSAWNLWSSNYLHHPVAVRRELYDAVGGLRSEFDGSQDLDMLLRVVEKEPRVERIPEILYHMRVHAGSLSSGAASKPKAHERGKRAVAEAFVRQGLPLDVEFHPDIPGYFIPVPKAPAGRIAVVGVDYDGKGFVEGFDAAWVGATVTRVAAGKDLARRVNDAALAAAAEVIVVADAQATPMQADWQRFAAYAMLPGVGLVCPQVRDCEGYLVSAGLVTGGVLALMPWHSGCKADDAGYGGWMKALHEVNAVSHRCLAVRKSLWNETGGFDARWTGGAAMAADWSLRLSRDGKTVHLCAGFVPVVLAHTDRTRKACALSEEDYAAFVLQWKTVLNGPNRLWNPNLSCLTADVMFAGVEDTVLQALGVGHVWDAASAKSVFAAIDA